MDIKYHEGSVSSFYIEVEISRDLTWKWIQISELEN